jgi:hypothetical protein
MLPAAKLVVSVKNCILFIALVERHKLTIATVELPLCHPYLLLFYRL